MRLDVEQPELEHREQAARARADDERVGLDHFGLGQHSENTLPALRNTVIVCMGDCLAGEMWRGKQKYTQRPQPDRILSNVASGSWNYSEFLP